uniref:BZIP domain-containing protein n=1 Tax=Acrobeloides nanus TaxID=290746 RepID=A0A914DRS9_9BILA
MTIRLIVESMKNLDLSAQNNCPLRKPKSMGNMLSCGGNSLTKYTEEDNRYITMYKHKKSANGLSSNLEFGELPKQLQMMARKMETKSIGSRRIVGNLRPHKINQSSLHKNKRRKRFSCSAQNANQFFNKTVMITNSNDRNDPGENISHNSTNQLPNMLSPRQTHQSLYPQLPQVHISQQQQPNFPNSHMMTICYANNENCCPCTQHFNLPLLPSISALQYTEMFKKIQKDFKDQGYMLCPHRCCSTQKSSKQRTVSRASPSLVSSSSDYYAHSMSDPASAGSTASIQCPPIPHRQTANVPTTHPSIFISPAASSSVGRPFPPVPPRANFTVNPTVPLDPNVVVHMHPVSFGNVSISQSSNSGRPLHAPQVPPHQPNPLTNIAASQFVNMPVHPSHFNTALAGGHYSESSSPFLQSHALQTQSTPQISYSFEPAPSRSASLNIDQSLIFTPRRQQIYRQPLSSGNISNNFASTSSNTSSHDSIATHIDTSDNQTTSPSDIPIGGNNMTSRKRPKTNGNNRSRKTERIKKDKSEIEKDNRETTRRLQREILEKCDENNKKIENVEKKVDNLSQDRGNVKILMQNFSQLSQDIGIMKNLVRNLNQLYLNHASGNAYSYSSQSIPSNSNSTPNHNTIHVTQSGTASWPHMDQFHQQESIIRESSSGCSSDNDIVSQMNILNE